MKNLYQKINEVMLKVTTVIKDAEIQMSSNRSYLGVSHDAVTSALHLPMAQAGIVLKVEEASCKVDVVESVKAWNGQETKTKTYHASVSMYLTLINADDPKERETSTFSAIAFDSGDKAIGKATSMAVKTGLLKLFMLESLDQEESRETEGAQYKERPKYQEPQKSQQPQAPSSQTAGQQSRIANVYSMAKKAGWNQQELEKVLKIGFNAKSINQLNDNQYGQLVKIFKDGCSVDQALSQPVEVCK